MQHTNDDIDELFRNAADSYPLKIKGASWDSVAAKLTDGGDGNTISPVVPLSSSGSNKNYRYLLLLLLIPIGFLTAKYTGLTGGNNTTAQTQPVADAAKAAPADVQKPVETPAPNTVTSNSTANKPGPGNAATATADAVTTGAVKNNATVHIAAGGAVKATHNNNDAAVKDAAKNNNAGLPGLGELAQVDKVTKLEKDLSQYKSSTVSQPANAAQQQPVIIPAASDNNNIAAIKPNDNQPLAAKDNDGIEKPHDQSTAQQAGVPAPGNDPPVNGPVKKLRQHRFYVGVLVAPDYTTIKYQPGNKVGFDFGSLVGYTISKSFSAEFGISLDKKYYTSDGRYYKSTEKWFQNAGTLLTLSGYSSLTEFPLNIRYNFKQDKNKVGNFFVAGGLVSYIVHSENYNYEFDKNGYIYFKDKSTKKSTSNMFANFNISAGYSSSLGNNVNFRIEPYYRIPIGGIGLGGLPITSVGLNIGVVKKF